MKLFIFLSLVGSLASADVSVRGYYKSNGTYVQPHQRTNPDSNPYNNYNSPGQYNPNKGTYNSGSSYGTQGVQPYGSTYSND